METINVFYIDDDIEYLSLITSRLCEIAKNYNINVVTYTFNCQKELQKFIEKKPEINCDLFITDYNLGSTDGFTLVKTIKDYFPNAIYILITSKGDKELVSKLIETEIDFYFHESIPIIFLAYVLVSIIKLINRIKLLEFRLSCQEKNNNNNLPYSRN